MNSIHILRNEDVGEIVSEIPEGHQHIRTTLTLADGTSITLQEATVAAIVRAYISIKTDPKRTGVVLYGQKMAERKAGFAEWQFLEK